MALLPSVKALTRGKFTLSISHGPLVQFETKILQSPELEPSSTSKPAILPIKPDQIYIFYLLVEHPYDFGNADYMRFCVHLDGKVINEYFLEKPISPISTSTKHCIFCDTILESDYKTTRMHRS